MEEESLGIFLFFSWNGIFLPLFIDYSPTKKNVKMNSNYLLIMRSERESRPEDRSFWLIHSTNRTSDQKIAEATDRQIKLQMSWEALV